LAITLAIVGVPAAVALGVIWLRRERALREQVAREIRQEEQEEQRGEEEAEARQREVAKARVDALAFVRDQWESVGYVNCPECQKRFETRGDFSQHFAAKHAPN
jgi:flagellar biosynthesis/type III secretory pathway M-ring protein FliF/YscJ